VKTARENQEQDTWGAIGIGAMIVFISLILVAAVASAVIIQTAEKLQQNAQRAGDDTSDELSGKLTIMQGFIEGGNYVLYVRLAPGSDSIPATSVSFQLFCDIAPAGSGYEDGALAAANVQLQSQAAFGAGVGTMDPQSAYKIQINANTCTPAAVGALGNPVAQLYLHIESGGSTFETLTVNNPANGNPVI
tara:strand:- start:11528 stop:12100 length:573 start_codon:yes stop_codon:yes gene_type:complete